MQYSSAPCIFTTIAMLTALWSEVHSLPSLGIRVYKTIFFFISPLFILLMKEYSKSIISSTDLHTTRQNKI